MANFRLINLPVFSDPRGSLTFAEANKHLPFAVKRAYWIYEVPEGQMRGDHAHKECHEILIAVNGSFEVEINIRGDIEVFSLNKPHIGLYIPPGIWTKEGNFSQNAVCLVLASHPYNENDYIRSYQEYLSFYNDPIS